MPTVSELDIIVKDNTNRIHKLEVFGGTAKECHKSIPALKEQVRALTVTDALQAQSLKTITRLSWGILTLLSSVIGGIMVAYIRSKL